jgi:LEA14-like dessication related protein
MPRHAPVRSFSLGLVALAVGCSKPQPPTLTPRSAQVSAINPDGVQLALVLGAHNPNGFPIVAGGVSGAFELQDGTPLGTAQSTESFTIPSEGDQDLNATLNVRFQSLSVLAPYALAAKPVPYRVRGSARIGSEHLNVDVPFSIDGVLTPQQVLAAGLHGAANLLNSGKP